MDLISFVVRRRLLVHLFVIMAVAVGVYHYLDMPRDFFPNANLDQAYVVVPWPGASPEEVEQEITNKLEEALTDLENLDEIQSNSEESSCTIALFMETDTDSDQFMMDLQTAINGVSDLPEDALDPIYFELTSAMISPVCYVSMGGDVPDHVLFEAAEDLKRDLETIDGMSKVEMQGFLDREIQILCDLDLMDHYGVSLGEIIQALATQNVDMPGGSAELGPTAYKLRVLGKYEDLEAIENTVLRAGPRGGKLRLGDLADVRRDSEDRIAIGRLDGQPAGNLVVYKDEEANALDVSADVRELVDHYNASLPVPVSSEVRLDSSELIEERLGVMTNNAWITAILVGLLLLFFIGWVNSVLVLVGIPFTFLVAFILMSFNGMSVNMLTLFALIMALGLIVDDAIVVVDNVQRYIERGVSPMRAAVIGTKEVMAPVISAVSTTCAGFLPVLFMTGMMGKFMSAIPKTVIFALLASLVEALVVLPAHTADIAIFNNWVRKRLGMKPKHVRISVEGADDPHTTQHVRRNPVFVFLRRIYRRQLAITLRRRYWAVASIVVLAIMSLGLVRMLPVRMFPDEDFDQIICQYDLPPGSLLEETDEITRKVEAIVDELPREYLKAVVSISGYQIKNYEFVSGTHLGEVNLDLVSAADRDRSDREIMEWLRGEISKVPGIVELNLSRPQGGPPSGKPVEIKILGPRLEVLEELAGKLKGELETLDGVVDIRDDFTRDGREFLVDVDRERAAELGLRSQDVAVTINAAFQGYEATQFTEEGGQERPVIVRLKDRYRDDIDSLDRLKVASMAGLVPLGNLAEFRPQTNLRSIRHSERERAITVTAELEGGQNSTAVNRIIQERLSTFSTDHPGYRLFFGGEFERTQESFMSLLLLLPVALLIIFTILAGQFNSLSQPLAVLFTVPLSFIGVVIGLLVMGYDLTIPAMVGIIALMGLVVNNSLLMVDFINKARARNLGRWESIIRSGVVRLRPILLTTVTTITGLSTLTVASTGATKIMVPMAVSMIWGLAFATVLTLFLIPALIGILDDIRLKMGLEISTRE